MTMVNPIFNLGELPQLSQAGGPDDARYNLKIKVEWADGRAIH
jgi:hypothetical protein